MESSPQRKFPTISWFWHPLNELSLRDVHDLFQARQEVFSVEQKCFYLDVDGRDFDAWHLLGRAGPTLAAYCRVLPPGVAYAELSLGRVLTRQPFRGQGLGKILMRAALARCERMFPGQSMRISAQSHLERFYREFQFCPVGEEYLEDGIPHLQMVRSRPES